MKEIPLTKGQVALVDDDDFERINAHKWHATRIPGTESYYAVRSSPPDANGKRHTISMHREVMRAKPGEEVDHVHHNTLDQQKENLRICTRGQNCSNTRTRADNKSGYKGVTLHKKSRKWRARVNVNGNSEHIGLFSTALEAAIAYDTAAIKYHGASAYTNAMMGLLDLKKET